MLIAVFFGVFSGFYPAWKMSRLNPVNALRGGAHVIRHLLKLVWRRKRANALLIVEIFFSFLVFFAVVTLGDVGDHALEQAAGFRLARCLVLNVDIPSNRDVPGEERPWRQRRRLASIGR